MADIINNIGAGQTYTTVPLWWAARPNDGNNWIGNYVDTDTINPGELSARSFELTQPPLLILRHLHQHTLYSVPQVHLSTFALRINLFFVVLKLLARARRQDTRWLSVANLKIVTLRLLVVG